MSCTQRCNADNSAMHTTVDPGSKGYGRSLNKRFSRTHFAVLSFPQPRWFPLVCATVLWLGDTRCSMIYEDSVRGVCSNDEARFFSQGGHVSRLLCVVDNASTDLDYLVWSWRQIFSPQAEELIIAD